MTDTKPNWVTEHCYDVANALRDRIERHYHVRKHKMALWYHDGSPGARGGLAIVDDSDDNDMRQHGWKAYAGAFSAANGQPGTMTRASLIARLFDIARTLPLLDPSE